MFVIAGLYSGSLSKDGNDISTVATVKTRCFGIREQRNCQIVNCIKKFNRLMTIIYSFQSLKFPRKSLLTHEEQGGQGICRP